MKKRHTKNKPILVIETGDCFEEAREKWGNFGDWIAKGLLEDDDLKLFLAEIRKANFRALSTDSPIRIIHAQSDQPLPDTQAFAGIVISGSHAMVTDHLPWSERLAEWIRACVTKKIPVLGICYGHQLLAYALGGEVAFRKQGAEVGSHEIRVTENADTDPLFHDFPASFFAQLVHSQSVISMPPGAVVLAGNDNDSHQSFRYGECAWGVQFHPEFSTEIMKLYIDKHVQSQAEKDSETICEGAFKVEETPEASSLLNRFAQWVWA